ncbi:TetR/AcrR family transcriptional regulator [Nocardia cyriacigeorgica]|uniref:TetR/AcrR family transcriptional regulator n=1 Tax=Nocardia cyriacigeorgica TaxID=135487 RepID=A0ABX0CSI9_9NOCA|nr:TetR/AcrR family transcriptional regulator [Nocardia cyriacigeorgica]NEW38136.1 TetR/AcrR family transcriptional regulator [Nocardia cyriacigeorgica]NEW57531.1 TetR/AcrR family transcriptional regulator [Nocardia cyriacigeorgica]
MTGPADDIDSTDPRRARSRARLLDAAAALLKTDGLEAVTVEAVSRMSKVAKTTLYRHFDGAAQLRAATLARLLPPVIDTPAAGPLRERLIVLLERQAGVIREAPLQLSTLAWLATGAENADTGELSTLRHRLIEQYRVPFDRVLDTADARAELGDFDLTLAITQLIGPLIFARMVGLGPSSPDQRMRIVDDFLIARGALSR